MPRKPSLTITIEFQTYADILERMKGMGEDPDERGAISRYVEDAIKTKNKLVEAKKWVPAEDVDPKHAKLTK